MNDRPKNCASCKFYEGNPKDLRSGHCHRFPPKGEFMPTQTGITIVPMLPPVQPKDWCGEHQLRFAISQDTPS